MTSCGRTVLHHATQSSGFVSIVELLVCNHDFNPNVKDSLGLTPLHEAVRYLNSAVELLLDYRGDPTIEDCDGRSLIAFAVSMSSYDTLKLLLNASELDENTGGSKILQDALSRGKEDIIELLVTEPLSWIARDAFEYLLDLNDVGYKSEELVFFLLDKEDSSPWILPEGWGEQLMGYEPQIRCDFHRPSCAHTCIPKARLELPKQSEDNLPWAGVDEEMIAKPEKMKTMRNTVYGLCGIGGVLPPQDTTTPSNEIEFLNGGAIMIYDVRVTETNIHESVCETVGYST